MSRLAVLTLRLQRRKAHLASAAALMKSIARDRERGPALPGAGMRRRYTIDDRALEGGRVITLATRDGATEPVDVVYFPGGSYVHAITKYSWQMLDRLVRAVSRSVPCRVTVALYPLAPEASFVEVHAFARAAWSELPATSPKVLMGDSAGAGLALALTHALRDAGERLPAELVLISPWLDVTMEDPGIAAIDPRDPMLAAPGSREAGRLYARGSSTTDPRVSPLFGSHAGLPPTTVFAGTRDILLVDARRFRERAGVNITYREGSDMIHDWPLVVLLPEARAAIETIAGIVRSVAERRLAESLP